MSEDNMNNKWDFLDDDYEDHETFEPIRKSTAPEGSLTDNARFIQPRRNGAHRRVRQMQRQMKEHTD